jgi:integrase
LPKLALTDAVVQRKKAPDAGQVEYFDKGYPGLALRISYGGSKSFVFFYRVGGKLRRMTLGTYPAVSLADAREAWRNAREEAKAGRDPSQARKPETGATDFTSVFLEWLKRDQSKNRSHDSVKRLIEKDVLPTWGHRQIGDLDRRDVLDVIDAIVDRGSPISACQLHAHLHRLFRWSVGRGIIKSNPMADMPRPASAIKRDRVLTDDELAAVWRAAEQLGGPFGAGLKMLILTGARREEIGQLQWSEIYDGEIRLGGNRTKNGHPHHIPLSTAAVGIIENLQRIAGSEFVFTLNGKRPIVGWSQAKARIDAIAEIASWRIHDLRRTAATGLQKLKTPLQVTEAILGHNAGSRAGIVGVYQRHDYADEKRAALEAWGAHVMALVQP